MTLVVNFYGGPGTGKSTTTALTFGKLKRMGYNVEIAHEFAKDLVWEGRSKALHCQPYIIGKQIHKIERLVGEVDAIITDSPILFGAIYGERMPLSWFDFLGDYFRRWNTLNIFLKRDLSKHPYNPKGRTQTEEEAVELDAKIKNMLHAYNVDYHTIKVTGDDLPAYKAASLVVENL